MSYQFRIILIIILGVFTIGFKGSNKSKFDFHKYWLHYNNFQCELEVNKDYKKALIAFSLMESVGNNEFPSGYDYISKATCFSKLKDSISATESLRKAVLHGVTNIMNLNWVKDDVGTFPFEQIRKEMPDLIKKYYASVADKIPAMLEEKKLSSIDQFVRSPDLMKLISKQDFEITLTFADSANITEYINNIKAGITGPQSFLLYHLYGSNDKYVPFLDSCMKLELYSGKVSPFAYSFWIDRQHAYVENKPQKYGSFTAYKSYDSDHPNIIGKILNVDSVDIYRKEIGLPPLWQDAKRIGFELPKDYKK